MYVSVRHSITDSQKWDQTTKNVMALTTQGRLPRGLKGLMYLPSADGRTTDCVWEASLVEALKRFLDPQIGTAARNEYIPIKAEAAFGLPGQHDVRMAA